MKVKKYALDGKKDITIAHISDLHFSPLFKRSIFLDILEVIKKEKPNYLCITGDLIDYANILNKQNYCAELEQFFKKLGELTIVLYGLGNHDVFNYKEKGKPYKYYEDWFSKLNQIPNVYYLNQSIYEDENIWCYGLTLNNEYYITHEKDLPIIQAPLKHNNDKYKIVLCHSPYYIVRDNVLKENKWLKDMDLILSGHMHNGLFFPFLEKHTKSTRGFVSPFFVPFPKYARGIIKVNEITLIIAGAITTFSSTAPKVFHKFNKYYDAQIGIIKIKKSFNKFK